MKGVFRLYQKAPTSTWPGISTSARQPTPPRPRLGLMQSHHFAGELQERGREILDPCPFAGRRRLSLAELLVKVLDLLREGGNMALQCLHLFAGMIGERALNIRGTFGRDQFRFLDANPHRPVIAPGLFPPGPPAPLQRP